jgi:parallel beta-helix repeat protein
MGTREVFLKSILKLIALAVLMCSLVNVLGIQSVNAYKSGSGNTHQFIFEQAKTILRNDGYRSLAEFLESLDPADPYGRTYQEVLIAGSDDHDDIVSAREHYLDPMDHRGLLFVTYQKSAGTLCQERFDEALMHWHTGDYHEAIYDLGWAAHAVQDVCVPHHVWTTWLDWHSEYESWVNDHKESFAVNSNGIYSFDSFPDRSYYRTAGSPPTSYWHYSGNDPTAYDWVDYNAHESIKYFLTTNSYVDSNQTDAADPYIETTHNLPDNLNTTWVIATYRTSGMQLHFESIDMEENYDFIRIYDKNDNLLGTYTGQYGDFWSPWYDCQDTLKIKTVSDGSVQSWGYKVREIKYYDTAEDCGTTTSFLLPQAQRTTAGFIKFFFDRVLNTIHIRPDGSIYPLTSSIERNGNVYTLMDSVNGSIEIERNNIVVDGNGHVFQALSDIGDGVHLCGRTNVTVQNLSIAGFRYSVFLLNSTNANSIVGNRVTTVSYACRGIRLLCSSNNTVSKNNVEKGKYGGIDLDEHSDYNVISGNNVTASNGDAIFLGASSNNTIVGNRIGSSYGGIDLRSSSNYNVVSENTIEASTRDGIEILFSSNNKIVGNSVTTSGRYGILLQGSSSDLIYHNNFLNNALQAASSGGSVWDNGCEGNYWSDYNGTDSDGDGVGDTKLPWQSVDNCPLMSRYWNPGDINHDLKVDLKDVFATGRAYGTEPGVPRWNPHCDINEDDKVDLKDYYTTCKNYGKSWQ